jgi:hypothetical protein
MSEGIQFDEDSMSSASREQMARRGSEAEQSGMVGWIMRRGLANTPAKAQGILIGLIVACLVMGLIVINSI